MAITDADRDAVVTALKEWTATMGEAYVRARALARQTGRSSKTVGTLAIFDSGQASILPSLSGSECVVP